MYRFLENNFDLGLTRQEFYPKFKSAPNYLTASSNYNQSGHRMKTRPGKMTKFGCNMSINPNILFWVIFMCNFEIMEC